MGPLLRATAVEAGIRSVLAQPTPTSILSVGSVRVRLSHPSKSKRFAFVRIFARAAVERILTRVRASVGFAPCAVGESLALGQLVALRVEIPQAIGIVICWAGQARRRSSRCLQHQRRGRSGCEAIGSLFPEHATQRLRTVVADAAVRREEGPARCGLWRFH
jgi:hypothetical protein